MRTARWAALAVVLLFANVGFALAHNWWYWTWGRTDMKVFEATRYVTEAEAARKDWIYPHTHLSLLLSAKHADISLIDGDYGKTQWSGLATVESSGRYWPWACGGSVACRFVHAHARVNTAEGLRSGAGPKSDIRGVFCQELGHTLGLDHSIHTENRRTNDCMGKGYGNNSNVAGWHAWADINARY
jgi:hypothetical protein